MSAPFDNKGIRIPDPKETDTFFVRAIFHVEVEKANLQEFLGGNISDFWDEFDNTLAGQPNLGNLLGYNLEVQKTAQDLSPYTPISQNPQSTAVQIDGVLSGPIDPTSLGLELGLQTHPSPDQVRQVIEEDAGGEGLYTQLIDWNVEDLLTFVDGQAFDWVDYDINPFLEALVQRLPAPSTPASPGI